jgi:hypothetical protein
MTILKRTKRVQLKYKGGMQEEITQKKKKKKNKKEHIDNCFSVLIKLILATKNKGKAWVINTNNVMRFPIHTRNTQARTKRTIYATQRVQESHSYLRSKILQLNYFLSNKKIKRGKLLTPNIMITT